MSSLTIIYDPFKFDHESAASFDWFRKTVLPNGCNPQFIKFGLQPPSGPVLLLGHKSLEFYTGKRDLQKNRGYPQFIKTAAGVSYGIATIHPEDARSWTSSEEEDDGEDTNEKDIGKTKPNNWRGWIKRDTEKLLRGPTTYEEFRYSVISSSVELGRLRDCFSRTHGSTIYLDIETRYGDYGLNCIGLARDDRPVAVVPIYYPDDRLAFPAIELCRFFRTLSRVLQSNRVVIHHAGFDLSVLSWCYGIPFGHDIYDTMLATHRCYPELEKSLSHAISLWTWLPQHKDMSNGYHSFDQAAVYWEYNARDVYAMREVYKAQQAFIPSVPGLQSSVDQVMASIPIYLEMSLTPLKVNRDKLYNYRLQHTRRLHQLERIATFLSGIPGFNPASPQQCIKYFHERLKYKVVGRNRETNAASLDQKNLYKLRLQHNNPLIDTIIAYRELAKELSMLHFKPYEPWSQTPGIGYDNFKV